MRVFPTTPQKSAYEWFLLRDNIDFSPSYQRRSGLWPLRNQALLINSIINGYDVPKIYLADFSFGEATLQEKRKLYAIVDGKQRLTTLVKFFEDDLALDSTPVKYSGKTLDLGGAKYSTIKSLYPELAIKIEKFNLSMMSVITDDEKEIRELFVRLNLNTTISGPEIRNAMPGPIPQIIRLISLNKFFSQTIRFSTQRGQDFNFIAKVLLIESGEAYQSLGKARLDNFVLDNIGKSYEDYKAIEKKVLKNLDFLSKVFDDYDDLLSSQNSLVVITNS